MKTDTTVTGNIVTRLGLAPRSEWETKTLGEFGEFIKGAPLSKADIAKTGAPLILYGELYTTYSEVTYNIVRRTDKSVKDCYLSHSGDIVIPTSGETAEDIATATCVMRDGVILAGDLYIYRLHDDVDIDPRIVSYLIKHQANRDIARIAQGKTVAHVRADELRKITITYPTQPEDNQRLLSLLSSVDAVIDACRAEVDAYSELARTMSHDLLLGLRRFKREDGSEYPEWETKAFGELYDESTERNGDSRLTMDSFISVASMTYKRLTERELPAESSVKSYKVVRVGDVAFEGHRNKAFSHGRFVLNDAGVGLVSSIFKCFRPKPGWEDSNDLRFWKHYVHSEDVMHDVTRMSTNAGVMMDTLVPADFLRQSVPVPCLEEQRRIGEALDAAGFALDASRKVLAGYEELKRSLLSELFA